MNTKLHLLFCLLGVFVILEAAILARKPELRFRVDTYTEDTIKSVGQTGYIDIHVTKDGAVEENDDWKFCTWTRTKDGEMCRFSYLCEGFLCDIGSGDFRVETECSQGLRDVTFYGEDPNFHNRICGIKIPNMGNDDNSYWNVTVQDCHAYSCGTDDGSDRFAYHSTKITMLQGSNVTLTSSTLNGNVSVGSTHKAVCQLANIRPAAALSWTMRGSPYYGPVGDLQISHNADGSIAMRQEATLKIDSSMNGAKFACNANVKNQSAAQEVIFSSSAGIDIKVKPSVIVQ